MRTNNLTASDFMVGNYMKYKDGTIVQIARVGDVSPMDAPIYCHTQLEGYFPCQFDDISPIPLTAEILEKNGFEEDDYFRYTFYFDNRRVRSSSIEVVPQDENWSEIEMTIRSGRTDITSVVEYVHELQHALRFCGIDKEIKL